MSKTITRAALILIACLALSGASLAAPRSAGLAEPPVFAFYPQAGIPWDDLYFGNFVDLDPGPGVLDCRTAARRPTTATPARTRSSVLFREKQKSVFRSSQRSTES